MLRRHDCTVPRAVSLKAVGLGSGLDTDGLDTDGLDPGGVEDAVLWWCFRPNPNPNPNANAITANKIMPPTTTTRRPDLRSWAGALAAGAASAEDTSFDMAKLIVQQSTGWVI